MGARYGLELHWGKFPLLQVRTSKKLRRPDGCPIDSQEPFTYPGATLSSDGLSGSELNRSLGRACSGFRKSSQLWKHTSLPRAHKLQILQSNIASLVLSGLDTMWFDARQQRQLDGFQARCLRDILKIPHPYLSRVSNKAVLEGAGWTKGLRYTAAASTADDFRQGG